MRIFTNFSNWASAFVFYSSLRAADVDVIASIIDVDDVYKSVPDGVGLVQRDCMCRHPKGCVVTAVIIKSVVADLGRRGCQTCDVRQRGTSHKCHAGDRRDGTGDVDARQPRATIERPVGDSGDGSGQVDVRQSSAPVERLVAEAGDGIRDVDARQSRAKFKC